MLSREINIFEMSVFHFNENIFPKICNIIQNLQFLKETFKNVCYLPKSFE